MHQYPFRYVLEVKRDSGKWDSLIGTDKLDDALARAEWMVDKLRPQRTAVRVVSLPSQEVVYEENTYG